ncbi:MAG TPA: serine hydrolase domain-containing protein [Clostridia bacterium]|nr:serine hydrolase domain-containing protein [Clostridia bacterium]
MKKTFFAIVLLGFACSVIAGYPQTQTLPEKSAQVQHWQPLELLLLSSGAIAQTTATAASERILQVENSEARNLDSILEKIRNTHKVPALACAVVLSNRIVGLGAVGLRKSGVTNAPVTLQDKWHHGSITKSMTATLAAIMVERGAIQWTNTLADVFPSLTNCMHSAFLQVTLEQLTSNRGGVPEAIPPAVWSELWDFDSTPREARRLLLERMTTNAPSSAPGTRFEYSNAGFAIAGHMLETVAGKPWEELLVTELFKPLGMTSAGFGVPATPRYINHPWGHTLPNPSKPPGPGNALIPMEPGTNADNPPAIGPAGTVHCSLTDLATYVAFHLAVDKSDTPILHRASGRKLHTECRNNSDYAYGWNVVHRDWAKGKALNHTGSNTQWYSNVWLAPERDFAVIALCNLGGDTAFAATDAVAAAMIQQFLR